MIMIGRRSSLVLTLVSLVLGSASTAQDTQPVEQAEAHTTNWPTLSTGGSPSAREVSLQLSPEMRRGVSPREALRERRRLDAALDALEPQNPGIVDTYVVSIALDSDPVFGREAREAGRVLSRRYGADDRTIVLAGPDGRSQSLPQGSIRALTITLARLAEIMDRGEDVLVMYSTSHGLPQGLSYHYGDTGFGILSPQHLRDMLLELDLKRRILIISACYSGVFVPYLATPEAAILTASAFNRTSFGCAAENDWTFFGDALINNALRKPQGLLDASAEAHASIAEWEANANLTPSLPQTLVGQQAGAWLAELDARIPKRATEPVGRPAVEN